MPKLSVIQFAASLDPPITRQRVNDFVIRGDIIRGADKKIDTDHPRNAAWIRERKGAPPPATGKPGPDIKETISPDNLDDDTITEALSNLLAHNDIRKVSLAEVQKLHKIEAALKTRVDRQYKRQELIDRALVRTVFGRIYQIQVQELKTLGSKIAPEVAAMMKIDDPALQLQVEQRIDKEVLKGLNHIKRVIDDFLRKIE